MKTAKKLLASVLALSMVLSLFVFSGTTAAATDEKTYELAAGTDVAAASLIALGETVYGSFDAADKMSYYKVNLPASAILTVNLNCSADYDFFIYTSGTTNNLVLSGPTQANVDPINHGYASSTATPAALAAGTYIIIIDNTALDDEVSAGTFNFTLTVPGLAATPSLTISSTAMEIPALYSRQLRITSKDPTDINVFWESADTDIATVSSDGMVDTVMTATQKTVAIKGVVFYLGTRYFIKCTITVVAPNLYLNTASLRLGLNGKYQIKATTSPEEATIFFESSNPNIVSIDANGNVSALSSGLVDIKVYYIYKGYEISRVIPAYVDTSIISVQGVEADRNSAKIKVGNTVTLAAAVTPSNATTKAIKWTSSDPAIATVNADTGVVTGIKAGTVTITATSTDGSYTDTVEVTVRNAYPNWVEFFLYPITIIVQLFELIFASTK